MERYDCKICSEEFIIEESYQVPTFEINFPKGKFEYIVCSHCGSIQIKNIPDNLSDYYDNDNYYSFTNFNKLISFLLSHFYKNYFHFDLIGYLTSFFLQYDESWNSTAKLFKNNIIDFISKILDVGCGNGIFINHLSHLGFKNLEGTDPFIQEAILNDSYKVFKKEIQDLESTGEYDLILFKDSLEHVFNPIEILSEAERLLSDEGRILITIPLKNGVMWDMYKEYSFILCPPTHIAVPSLKGLEFMASECNLEICEIICDSNEFLLLMSEDKLNHRTQYSKDSISSYFNCVNPLRKFYNIYLKKFNTTFFKDKPLTIHQVHQKVNDLNNRQETDHATIILKKIHINQRMAQYD